MAAIEEFRSALVRYLATELVGPEKEDEVLVESPCRRYVAGILFPGSQRVAEAEDDAESKGAGSQETKPPEMLFDAGDAPAEPRKAGGGEEAADAGYDDTIAMANAFFPAAMGLSFICEFPVHGLKVTANAAVYEKRKPQDEKNLSEWKRAVVPFQVPPLVFDSAVAVGTINQALTGKLLLRALYRRRKDGTLLVTVSIYNSNKRPANDAPSATECYFQTAFEVESVDQKPIFHEYRDGERPLNDPEEASLALLYRNRRAYAVGHGCTAEWHGEAGDRCARICTVAVPASTVSPIEPKQNGGDELSMYFLSGAGATVTGAQVVQALTALADEYGEWIGKRIAEEPDLPERLREAAQRHMRLCDECHRRIKAGIALLGTNESVLRAFMLANQVMLMQQQHSRRPKRHPKAPWTPLPVDYRPAEERSGRWRSFQLAFVLMNLPSLMPKVDGSKDEERETVDLIWFPTGGGKTEAYLGLTAYAIFLRRLFNPANSGCTALMRYTLRLLTSQQFQRASSMICACELIRGRNESELGCDRISIGLWVGQSLAPNTRADAVQAVNGLAKESPDVENPFQVLTCPWCGTAMDDPKHLGYVPRGRPLTVQMICPEPHCPFSKGSNTLPIFVVDEDIYESPPSLIIGTVDKFAMLAWRPEAGSIFGLGRRVDPPDLIIQDELHLISGPLGSMVGLYESVIDLLCSKNGRRPKVVASTATIRRAADQCRCLYDRKTFQFPPAGLDVSDSFFAVENRGAVGRQYVGVFASGAPSYVTALVRTASALLQGCRSLPLTEGTSEALRDPYWTLLQYFSSLRELGRAATLVEADIPEYMWAMASRSHIPKELCRHVGSPVELTSRRSAQEIPEILERLKVTYPRAGEADARPIDTLLATNMISVGVDVERLGLMLVVGQPKTTSEYIQASSRVGRSAKAPGLVVTLYNPGKPRDRSHFEHFHAYHAAFYRFVEPTSVTPFSLPVLERALHALLVVVERHLCQIANPDQFDPTAVSLHRFVDFIERRCRSIDPEHSPELVARIEKLMQHWKKLLPDEWGRFGPVPEGRPLMYPAGTSPRPEWDNLSWETPSSLRNVDVECEGGVLGMYPGTES